MNIREWAEKSGAEIHELTELKYADKPGDGPWRLYVFGLDNYHSGAKWFRNGKPKYPDEEISVEEAYQNAIAAASLDREVRIRNGDDHLVFHSCGGEIIHGADFWGNLGFDIRKHAEQAPKVQLAQEGIMRDGLCIECGKPALPNCYSEAGRREYAISGMCERCFDGMFEE